MKISDHLLSVAKTLIKAADVVKLADMVEPLKSGISAIFPESFVNVQHTTGIHDTTGVWFALEPKGKWENGIFHNTSNIVLSISEKDGGQHEGDSGVYTVKMLMTYGLPVKFIARSGPAAKIVPYVISYFQKLKAANPVPKVARNPQ